MSGRPGAEVRVLVVGSPGAGKTTLARQLGASTGLPVCHLDDEYWGPDWTAPEPAEWARRQAQLTHGAEWVIDGNHLSTLALRAPRATLVVLVDTPAPVCAVRVVRRALRTRRGDHSNLPRRVFEQAAAGLRVRATKDFRTLLTLVLRFRRRHWWRVVEIAQAADVDVVLAVASPGSIRAPLLRHRLARRGVVAPVIGLTEVIEFVGRSTPARTGGTGMRPNQEGG